MSKTRNPDALIRIEDAIKVLCREKCYPGALCPDSYCSEMWDEFDDVERVDAVPVVHGHWIEVNDSYNRISGRCSVCGWESHMYEDDVVGMDFCPHCGAKMDRKDGDNG